MARPIENTERLNVFVTPEILEKLHACAKEKGMSISGIIRMIIMEYLKDK